MAAAQRALTVVSMVLLVLGLGLLGWSIAPPVGGFDSPQVVLDKSLTGPAGQNFTATPFTTLDRSGGTYRLEVDAKEQFTVGQRRADRDSDVPTQTGSHADTAGGAARYYWSKEFSGTIRSDAVTSPEAGPMEFFIKFPASTAPQTFHAVAYFTPTWAIPFVFLKTWASIAGLIIAGIGVVLFLIRAAMPVKRGDEPPAE